MSCAVWLPLLVWEPCAEGSAGGPVRRVWGPDCPNPFRQAYFAPTCHWVEQNSSQFQLLFSNWPTMLAAQTGWLSGGCSLSRSARIPGFPQLHPVQSLIHKSCGLGIVAIWCHQSLLSTWCMHFWFCCLGVLSSFMCRFGYIQ